MSKTKHARIVLLLSSLTLISTTVLAQKPVISSISPSAAASGESSLTITLKGSNFGSGSTVLWNGMRRLSTLINNNQLQIVVSASDLAAAGQAAIQITNPAGKSNTVYFVISDPPGLAITTTSLPGGTAGALYSTVLAATGGTPPFDWNGVSLLSGLTLSPSGALSGTIAAPGSYLLIITVRDAANLVATRSFTLKIDLPSGLVIVTQSLSNGTAGILYTPTALAASGGKIPYTWSIVKGKLPAGMTLSSSGTLSGIPAASGNYSFAVQVSDSATNTANLTYSLTVTTP